MERAQPLGGGAGTQLKSRITARKGPRVATIQQHKCDQKRKEEARLWNDQLCFVIEDDGPGIPTEERERIFERFVQGSGDRPGSGLGLALCKLVVEQHGGHIWAEPVESGGARVCFALPLVAPAHTAAA